MTGGIWTWGYQGATTADLLELCRKLRITAVVDCRRKPMSRVPGFGGNQLKTLFDEGQPGRPTVYVQRGDVLGGTPASMQTADGLPPPVAPGELARLRVEAERGGRMLLICQEHAPGECHRHHTVALPLARAGVTVRHVFEGELIDPIELQRALDDPDPDAAYECEVLEDAEEEAALAKLSPEARRALTAVAAENDAAWSIREGIVTVVPLGRPQVEQDGRTHHADCQHAECIAFRARRDAGVSP